MPDSIRQQIVTAVLARLRTIKVAAGYETDLGYKVEEWRDLEAAPFAQGDLTAESTFSAVNVKDKAEPATDALVQGRHEKDLQFELEIGTRKTSTDPNQSTAYWLRKLIADIEKSMANHTQWIIGIHIQGVSAVSVNDMAVVHAGDLLGQARLEVSIKYTNRRFDPYNT